MGHPWIATQLVIGSHELSRLSRAELVRSVTRAVARARDLGHLDALLLWPAAETGLTCELAQSCRSEGVIPLLWFPVLSDAPGVTQPEESLVIGWEGIAGHGMAGAWEGLSGGEERFLFSCPNNARYLDSVFQALAKLLDETGVEGVMLDKIRFPAPSNGLETLFGCFCPACNSLFASETGGSLDAMRHQVRELLRELRGCGPAGFLAAWKESGSFWKAAGLEELGRFRERSVLRAVGRLSSLAHERGREVGLDLYSPSLASLVGQEYGGLSSLCDWVKPMLYCRAVGPAGLPLEIASLWRGLRILHSSTDAALIRAGLREIFTWDLPDTEADLLARGLPADVISSELARLSGIALRGGVRVYAGIEAVHLPFFGIDISPEVLRASLAEARGSANGVIASWSLLDIPEDNLRELGAWEAASGTGP